VQALSAAGANAAAAARVRAFVRARPWLLAPARRLQGLVRPLARLIENRTASL
jgi:hypothetical protein